MAENVFNEGGDFLIRVRDAVVAKQSLEQQISDMNGEMKRMDKNISAETKDIRDEISTTIKKRRNDVEDEYDKQLSQIISKRKKVESEKEKKIDAAKASRIKDETKGIVSDSKDAEKELKKLFRQNKVPGFCRSKLFYVMFMPEGMVQKLMMVVGYAILFVGFPGLIALLIRKTAINHSTMSDGTKTFLTVLIVAGLVLLLAGAIFLLYVKVKVPHAIVLQQGRKYRRAVAENDKQIRSVKKSIEKDEDESRYDVGEFDQRIREITDEEENVREEMHNALKDFDEQTAENIRQEVEDRRNPKLNEMKENRNGLALQIEQAQSQLKETSLVISRDYASHIGDDMLRQDRLEELIAIIQSGQANTVSEAISVFKNPNRVPINKQAPAAQDTPAPAAEPVKPEIPDPFVPGPEIEQLAQQNQVTLNPESVSRQEQPPAE